MVFNYRSLNWHEQKNIQWGLMRIWFECKSTSQPSLHKWKIVSEYDQEIPQSQTADNNQRGLWRDSMIVSVQLHI